VLISPKPDPTEKRLKDRHFSSDAEVIAAVENWLDGKPSELFLIGLQIFEWLVAVACFLPGRAKDLSAPLYNPTTPYLPSKGHIVTKRLF
jgi:hypothetical protein